MGFFYEKTEIWRKIEEKHYHLPVTGTIWEKILTTENMIISMV